MAYSGDYKVHDGGSLVLVRPLNKRCRAWLEDNTSTERTWFAGALAVEARYFRDLLGGLGEAGFSRQR
jgi:hypothetical protein